jgi:hypothetical protein
VFTTARHRSLSSAYLLIMHGQFLVVLKSAHSTVWCTSNRSSAEFVVLVGATVISQCQLFDVNINTVLSCYQPNKHSVDIKRTDVARLLALFFVPFVSFVLYVSRTKKEVLGRTYDTHKLEFEWLSTHITKTNEYTWPRNEEYPLRTAGGSAK